MRLDHTQPLQQSGQQSLQASAFVGVQALLLQTCVHCDGAAPLKLTILHFTHSLGEFSALEASRMLLF